jgi:RNA recognition motif-containing protein
MSINIYVGNLSFGCTDDELRNVFSPYGAVTSARVITDQATGRSRGFGFVEMANKEEGVLAIKELDSKEIGGRNLKVNEAKPKREFGGGGGRDRRSRW